MPSPDRASYPTVFRGLTLAMAGAIVRREPETQEDQDARQAVPPPIHEDRRPDRGPAGADPARGARPRPGQGHRGMGGVRPRAGRRPHPALGRAASDAKSDVPAEAMLDPVANTLDLRKPFDKDRAKRTQAALDGDQIGITDIGYFDNMLHDDPAIRKKKHDFMKRAMDAAVLLGVDAVCGFVGRNQKLSMDQNLLDFEEELHPPPQVREGAQPHLPRRAVPHAGLDHEGQLAQQHRLHPRHLDRAPPHLREATAWATSSASTTTPPTPSSWARTPARSSSTSRTRATTS